MLLDFDFLWAVDFYVLFFMLDFCRVVCFREGVYFLALFALCLAGSGCVSAFLSSWLVLALVLFTVRLWGPAGNSGMSQREAWACRV